MEGYQQAYQKALKLLKIRPHISKELAKKLSVRGYNAQTIAEVTERLKQQGLLDDEQVSKAFLMSMIQFKYFGFYGLMAKLLQRGVSRPDAEKLLGENFSINTEKEIASRLIQKHPGEDRVKLAQKLSRKGFRTEAISEVLKTHFF